MTRVRLYIAGSLVLVALAGCGRSLFDFAQREAWRSEAELACLKSGAVKENPSLVRIEPIDGPGVCGADYPLRVAALGATNALGFADEPQPPGLIPGGRSIGREPQWPIARTPQGEMLQWRTGPPAVEPDAAAPPLSLHPDAPAPNESQAADTMEIDWPVPAITPARRFYQPLPDIEPTRVTTVPVRRPPAAVDTPSRPVLPTAQQAPVSLGRRVTGTIGPVTLKPAATLACPIVSALDQWITNAVQPAAMRWFGQPVVEIRQISAYSCRGMNGNPRARISEHAFGNALDIAGFTLADGHTITIKRGWRGTPEEQGFLRDVQGAACETFTTVLAPGSNRFHYDHIHVDLMRRGSGRAICNPDAVPGELVAARAARKGYARRGDPTVTGSITSYASKADERSSDDDWIEHDGPRERID
jgi:hypothetical protein